MRENADLLLAPMPVFSKLRSPPFVQQASCNASEDNRKAERNLALSQNFGAALKARTLAGHWPVAVSRASRKAPMP